MTAAEVIRDLAADRALLLEELREAEELPAELRVEVGERPGARRLI